MTDDYEVGDLIKVRIPGERFWVEIIDFKEGKIKTKIDNNLVSCAMKRGDILWVDREDVLEKWSDEKLPGEKK